MFQNIIGSGRFRFGMCFPSSCSHEDISIALNNVGTDHSDFVIFHYIAPINYVSNEKEVKLLVEDYIMM